jgi:NitT/TauT family transport system substrate-binding protein
MVPGVFIKQANDWGQMNTVRSIVLLITCCLTTLLVSACALAQPSGPARDPQMQLTLVGAPVPLAALIAHMAESDVVTAVSDEAVFEALEDVRKLEQGIAAGQIHGGMASTSALAVLRNQGVPVQIVDVFGWGILHVLAGEKEIDSWQNLRGSKVAMPYRGSIGDVIFSQLASEAGMSMGDDLVMRYAANPLEAAEVLLGKQVQAAVLSEPWASVAIDKGIEEDEPIHRVMDLQTEWGALLGGEPRIPQLAFFVTDTLEESAAWAEASPDEAAARAAQLTRLSQSVAAESLQHTLINVIPAQEARAELERFFESLAESNPELIGGALPGDQFYAESARKE